MEKRVHFEFKKLKDFSSTARNSYEIDTKFFGAELKVKFNSIKIEVFAVSHQNSSNTLKSEKLLNFGEL